MKTKGDIRLTSFKLYDPFGLDIPIDSIFPQLIAGTFRTLAIPTILRFEVHGGTFMFYAYIA